MPKPITCLPRFEPASGLTRRRVLGLAAASLAAGALASCNDGKFHAIDISGSMPALAFSMQRASDGKEVTQADYRGKITLVYFGYTFCPDVCPTTLSNIAAVLRALGASARHVEVLFVTVDPNRDTLPVLADYVQNFGSEIDALRGTPDQLAALARRYRVVYSVEPATKDHPYEVTHSSAIYVFDGRGAARLLVPALDQPRPDIRGTTADLQRLIDEAQPQGWLARLEQFV